ncbi:MAG TPA: molybdenum cofactor guanylyltransferase [Microthrixaceae bacterium]|nr:molybdenum cofactor guanylyltransferase [Microthrixaceae bacterium]
MTAFPLGAVLVGGASRRMGRDKATLRLADGDPLGGRAIEALRPHVREVVLVGASPTQADALGERTVADRAGPEGPMAGVSAALDVAIGMGADRVVVLPCDLPRIGPDDVAALLAGAASLEADVVVVERDGREQWPCGVWSSRIVGSVEQRRGQGASSFAAVLEGIAVARLPLGAGFDDADDPWELDSSG